MEKITIDYKVSEHMKRIADALEEILRLVKEDQEKMRKIKEDNDFLDKQSNAEYYDLK